MPPTTPRPGAAPGPPPPPWRPGPPPSSSTPPAPPPAYPHRRVVLLGVRALVWLVYAYLIVTEVVLTLGFVLLLFGANPDASFVAWVYRSLDRAMEPFRGMFTPIDLGLSGNKDVGAVLDTSVLFAMLVYALGGWAVHVLLEWLGTLLARFGRADETATGTASVRRSNGGVS